MPKLLLDVPPHSGEYEFELDFTNREFHRMKVMCGLVAGDLGAAVERGDTDAGVAMAAVILARHGIADAEDALWDAPAAKIKFDFSEPDAGPPPVADQTSSGGSSTPDSGKPADAPSPTGDQP